MPENNIELNSEVQGLINAVNNYFPGEIKVTFIGQLQSGYVRHDQAQAVQDGKNIDIQIADLSAPNYTASHELLHVMMILRGFPQLFFSLTSGNQELDEQLQAVITELYDIVSHTVVVSEQRKHGLINEEIEAMYMKGIYATIKPEKDTPSQKTLQLITLLDAMVFYGDRFELVAEQLQNDFPTAYAAAEKLYQTITAKPTDSPFGLRRNVVKLFKAFDEQLAAWKLAPLHSTEVATLTSVLSERQLGLKVNQMFELYHSDMKEINSGKQGYVGFNKVDQQNSFVMTTPNDQDDPEFFKATYNKTVKELFDELAMPYIVRE
ncbi:IpaB/EvcA family protein [Lentilactobacillus senioris]|uniref:IpaB/EvcA family protein n=1 Tax=Lentilactobacillus senioris TaxID=931534 RepID=UPI002282F392|nr:IpaB/EvcA family protein [Lentilactobacillus senioris]MCY9807538.1 IpaB/EvcA family protein [Lentilactobacillus senioris]